MARPEFTPKEEFVIAYYRDRSHLNLLHAMGTEMACLVATLACIAFGLYKNDVIWVSVGLAPLVYLHVISILRMRNYMGAFHSIFTKYELALARTHSPAGENPEQDDAGRGKTAGDPQRSASGS